MLDFDGWTVYNIEIGIALSFIKKTTNKIVLNIHQISNREHVRRFVRRTHDVQVILNAENEEAGWNDNGYSWKMGPIGSWLELINNNPTEFINDNPTKKLEVLRACKQDFIAKRDFPSFLSVDYRENSPTGSSDDDIEFDPLETSNDFEFTSKKVYDNNMGGSNRSSLKDDYDYNKMNYDNYDGSDLSIIVSNTSPPNRKTENPPKTCKSIEDEQLGGNGANNDYKVIFFDISDNNSNKKKPSQRENNLEVLKKIAQKRIGEKRRTVKKFRPSCLPLVAEDGDEDIDSECFVERSQSLLKIKDEGIEANLESSDITNIQKKKSNFCIQEKHSTNAEPEEPRTDRTNDTYDPDPILEKDENPNNI